MKLYDNWKDILKRAWSIRFMVLAAVLSGIEVILPFFNESIPKNIFAALSFVCVSAAFVARLVAQRDV
jgi:hypothetical protein